MLRTDPELARHTQTLIADKDYRRASFERSLNSADITLIRPAVKGEPTKTRTTIPETIPSNNRINQTLKAQLDLEHHAGQPAEPTHHVVFRESEGTVVVEVMTLRITLVGEA